MQCKMFPIDYGVSSIYHSFMGTQNRFLKNSITLRFIEKLIIELRVKNLKVRFQLNSFSVYNMVCITSIEHMQSCTKEFIHFIGHRQQLLKLIFK